MTNDDLATRLAAMQKDFDDAPVVQQDSYPDQLDGIEDGDYQAKIWGWEVSDDYANHPGVVSLKTIVDIQHDAEHGGKRLEIFLWDILSERQLPFLKTHFHNLGVTDLDLTQIQNGSPLFSELNDTPVLIGIYTSKSINQKTGKPYRNIVIRQRLDDSDFGTAQDQIEGFEQNITPAEAKQRRQNPGSVAQMAATAERAMGKPDNCSCPDPANGVFDEENCPVPGHGIQF